MEALNEDVIELEAVECDCCPECGPDCCTDGCC